MVFEHRSTVDHPPHAAPLALAPLREVALNEAAKLGPADAERQSGSVGRPKVEQQVVGPAAATIKAAPRLLARMKPAVARLGCPRLSSGGERVPVHSTPREETPCRAPRRS